MWTATKTINKVNEFFGSLRLRNLKKQQSPTLSRALKSGGAKRIRTAVNGFADRYLTTRTWHHCDCGYKGTHYF